MDRHRVDANKIATLLSRTGAAVSTMENSDPERQAAKQACLTELLGQVQEFQRQVMDMHQTMLTLGDRVRSLEGMLAYVTTTFHASIYQEWQEYQSEAQNEDITQRDLERRVV